MDEFPVNLDDEPSPLSVCEVCRSPELREDFWIAFRVRVCESCARNDGSRGQTYGLITKSEAQVLFYILRMNSECRMYFFVGIATRIVFFD